LRSRQAFPVRQRGSTRRRLSPAVGERLDAAEDADGHGAAAHRAAPALGQRFARGKLHAAFAVAVEVILALLGKEFDGADKTLPGLQRFAQGEVVERAIERRRFAAELSR
jgi:hypothetical protein